MCREATLAAVRGAKSDTSSLQISADMLTRARCLVRLLQGSPVSLVLSQVKASVGDRKKFQQWNEKFGSY